MKNKYLKAFMSIAGAGIPGILLTALAEVPIFYLSLKYRLLLIMISLRTAFFLGTIFIILFLVLTIWALRALPVEKRGKVLVKGGPYRFIRHPSYVAKIFFLLPGIAVFFRVWLPIFSIPLLVLIWNQAIEKEEKELRKSFVKEFDEYKKQTGRFFPFIKG